MRRAGPRPLSALALPLALLAGLALAAPAVAAALSGTARVVDGDTLVVSGERVRLLDIDAPEAGQRCEDAGGRAYDCGAAATRALSGLIAGARVACAWEARDRWGRPLARCAAEGRDLGAALVRAGWALRYDKLSDAYAAEEAAAREAGAGLWQGSFVDPATWRAALRAAEREAAEARAPADPGCRIKGNISRNGRLYHLPEWSSWPKTRIDRAKGERWFCSEAEARAAGWRPAFGG